MLHLEPYIDAAIGTLRGDLAGKIATVNAGRADFSIPAPDPEAGIIWGVEAVIATYPVVEIAAPEQTLDNFSIDQVVGDSTVQIAVRGWLGRDAEVNSRERMGRAIYRFGLALLNTLLVPNAFGNHAVVERVRASYRLNPENRESEEVIGSTLLMFVIADQESPI